MDCSTLIPLPEIYKFQHANFSLEEERSISDWIDSRKGLSTDEIAVLRFIYNRTIPWNKIVERIYVKDFLRGIKNKFRDIVTPAINISKDKLRRAIFRLESTGIIFIQKIVISTKPARLFGIYLEKIDTKWKGIIDVLQNVSNFARSCFSYSLYNNDIYVLKIFFKRCIYDTNVSVRYYDCNYNRRKKVLSHEFFKFVSPQNLSTSKSKKTSEDDKMKKFPVSKKVKHPVFVKKVSDGVKCGSPMPEFRPETGQGSTFFSKPSLRAGNKEKCPVGQISSVSKNNEKDRLLRIAEDIKVRPVKNRFSVYSVWEKGLKLFSNRNPSIRYTNVLGKIDKAMLKTYCKKLEMFYQDKEKVEDYILFCLEYWTEIMNRFFHSGKDSVFIPPVEPCVRFFVSDKCGAKFSSAYNLGRQLIQEKILTESERQKDVRQEIIRIEELIKKQMDMFISLQKKSIGNTLSKMREEQSVIQKCRTVIEQIEREFEKTVSQIEHIDNLWNETEEWKYRKSLDDVICNLETQLRELDGIIDNTVDEKYNRNNQLDENINQTDILARRVRCFLNEMKVKIYEVTK